MIFGKNNAGDSNLPEEIKLTIFNFLPQKTKIEAQTVCKEWHRLLQDESLWKEYYTEGGPKNYGELIERIKVLPIKLRNLVLKKTYTLPFAEEMSPLLTSTPYERMDWVSMHYPRLIHNVIANEDDILEIYSHNLIQALKEKSITEQEILALPQDRQSAFLKLLGKEEIVVDLLREELFPLKQFATAYSRIEYLLDKPLLIFLKERILSFKEAQDLYYYLLYMAPMIFFDSIMLFYTGTEINLAPDLFEFE